MGLCNVNGAPVSIGQVYSYINDDVINLTWNDRTNIGQITLPAGTYIINGQAWLRGNVDSNHALQLIITKGNGDSNEGCQNLYVTGSNTFNVTRIIELSEQTTIYLQTYHNMSVAYTAQQRRLYAVRVG